MSKTRWTESYFLKIIETLKILSRERGAGGKRGSLNARDTITDKVMLSA